MLILFKKMNRSIFRCSSIGFLASVFVSLVSYISPARADDTDEQARVLYQKGNTAFKKGDEVMARKFYRESLELKESFDTACNLGRAEAQSKLYEEGYEHLRLCLYLYPADEELAGARAKFAALRDEVRNAIPTETQHEIDARFDEMVRRREGATEAPDSGLGEETEKTRQLNAASPTQERPGSADVVGSFGTTRAPSWKMPLVWGLAGVGVASGIFGGVMLAVASSASGEADDLKSGDVASCRGNDESRCRELVDAVKSYDSRKNISTVGFAAGGVLVIGAVVAYFAIPEERVETAGVTWTPLAGFTENGDVSFGLEGRF